MSVKENKIAVDMERFHNIKYDPENSFYDCIPCESFGNDHSNDHGNDHDDKKAEYQRQIQKQHHQEEA